MNRLLASLLDLQVGALGLSVLFFVRCAVFNPPDLSQKSRVVFEQHSAALGSSLQEPSREPFSSNASDESDG